MERKCINCDYFFTCKYTSEEISECEYFEKTKRNILKLEKKDGLNFEFKEVN